MSQVDLFDHFTARPETLTWIIENFEKSSNHISRSIKLLSSKLNLHLDVRPSEDVPNYYSGKQVVIFLNSYETFPVFYYRISLISENGLKWNTQEGKAIVGHMNSDVYTSSVVVICLIKQMAFCLMENSRSTVFVLNDECIRSGINRDNLVSLSCDNQSLLNSGKLSDVVVAVGGREFKAHKLILSSRSVVFEKMFEHDMEESKQNRVVIEDMSAGAVEDLLKFIYTGRVDDLCQHVYDLYGAADKYQIDSLKSYCELYLAMSLSVSTVPKTLQLADLYSLDQLKSKCINYITIHSTEFKFDDWKELTTTRPELMFGVFQALGNKAK